MYKRNYFWRMWNSQLRMNVPYTWMNRGLLATQPTKTYCGLDKKTSWYLGARGQKTDPQSFLVERIPRMKCNAISNYQSSETRRYSYCFVNLNRHCQSSRVEYNLRSTNPQTFFKRQKFHWHGEITSNVYIYVYRRRYMNILKFYHYYNETLLPLYRSDVKSIWKRT